MSNKLIQKLQYRNFLQRISDISYAYNQVNRSSPSDDEAIKYYEELIESVKNLIYEYEQRGLDETT